MSDPCQLIGSVHVQLTTEMRKKRNHLQKDTMCLIQNITNKDFLKQVEHLLDVVWGAVMYFTLFFQHVYDDEHDKQEE